LKNAAGVDKVNLILRSNMPALLYRAIHARAKIIVAQIQLDSIALYNGGYD